MELFTTNKLYFQQLDLFKTNDINSLYVSTETCGFPVREFNGNKIKFQYQ